MTQLQAKLLCIQVHTELTLSLISPAIVNHSISAHFLLVCSWQAPVAPDLLTCRALLDLFIRFAILLPICRPVTVLLSQVKFLIS